MKVARGTKDPLREDVRQIAIRFDVATFEKISALAASKGTPFAVMVRQLVAAGLKETK